MTIQSRSESETIEAGRRFAADLRAGDVVLLYGDLGAGKTAFVRGLAAGLGGDSDEVTSPTFTLVHEYARGRVPLFHADLYRLEPHEVPDLGLDDLAGEGVLAIEWPERAGSTLGGTVTVRIQRRDDDSRAIVIERLA